MANSRNDPRLEGLAWIVNDGSLEYEEAAAIPAMANHYAPLRHWVLTLAGAFGR